MLEIFTTYLISLLTTANVLLRIRIPAASFERFLLQALQASLSDGLARVASLLLNILLLHRSSLILHAVVHDAALATLR